MSRHGTSGATHGSLARPEACSASNIRAVHRPIGLLAFMASERAARAGGNEQITHFV
jgi:hypothetical protein